MFILWESFGFLKYTREGVRKDRLQQRARERSLATTGALVKRARRRERARAQTCRSAPGSAHKHEQARAGLAGGRVGRV